MHILMTVMWYSSYNNQGWNRFLAMDGSAWIPVSHQVWDTVALCRGLGYKSPCRHSRALCSHTCGQNPVSGTDNTLFRLNAKIHKTNRLIWVQICYTDSANICCKFDLFLSQNVKSIFITFYWQTYAYNITCN